MTPPVPSELTRLTGLLSEQTSARQRLEAALAELERRHCSILNSVNEIIFQTDLNGNWTFLNSAWSDFLEHSVRGNLGRPFTEHLHPEDRARARELIDALATGDTELVRAELRFRTGSGRERWFELLARPTVEGEAAGAGITGTLSDISARKRAEAELARLHQTMIEISRQAGMAEVATGVLHNVGNVLNSVNVSATLLQERLRKSKLSSLVGTADLLQEHAGELTAFLSDDPRGKLVPGFIIKLAAYLSAEQEEAVKELSLLAGNIEHIKQAVAMQQCYARVSGVMEFLSPVQLVEDVLRMNEAGLTRHGITVVREFLEVPDVAIDKHKALQVLMNLIRNAEHALHDSPAGEKRLTIRVGPAGPGRVRIVTKDNGVGIPAENLTRIFGHGFTTKKEGHGFGLHSGALAVKEMGGSITAQSEGLGKGAEFILELPARQRARAAA